MQYISLLEAQNRDLRAQGTKLREYIARLEFLFPQLMNQLQPAMFDTRNITENTRQQCECKMDNEEAAAKLDEGRSDTGSARPETTGKSQNLIIVRQTKLMKKIWTQGKEE
ncbi:hypothetical protein VFPPC_14969 [Pochonia chlamydosporia 170]|uniref:Uncharacterized protein n=1 Tax=Pochonia chlamydosporia 170 TaxID=1380566 RepID=A0A179EYI8_METCM|nr:hypothetical protein VFPPC_14969 [Pochonia chlamydosporia 170]OAQ57969.1 hypothetical protein VFPPC_14969 [Pochonia chlamydosporia 170]